jgi:PAS domain S-box-containing protein
MSTITDHTQGNHVSVLFDVIAHSADFDQASGVSLTLWLSRQLEHIVKGLGIDGAALFVSDTSEVRVMVRQGLAQSDIDTVVERLRGLCGVSMGRRKSDTRYTTADCHGILVLRLEGRRLMTAESDLPAGQIMWSAFAVGDDADDSILSILSVLANYLSRVTAATLLVQHARAASKQIQEANCEMREMQVCSLNIMEDLQRRNSDLQKLNTAAQDMAQWTTLPQLMKGAAEAAAEICEGTSIAIFVRDEHDDAFRLRHLTSEAVSPVSGEFDLTPSDDRYREITSGESIKFDCADGTSPLRIAGTLDCKSGLIIPLRSMTNTLGFILVCESRWHRVFSDEEIENLGVLSSTLAVAVQNATLLSFTADQVEQLSILNEYIETVVDSVDLGVLVVDTDLNITVISKGFERLYGYRQENFVGKPIFEALPHLLKQGFAEIIQQVFNGQPFERLGWRRELRDGREVVQNIRVFPHRDAIGRIVGAIAIVGDVTEKVNLEDQLARSEAKFSQLVEQLDDAYMIVVDGRIAYANMAAARLTGTPAFKLVGNELSKVIPDEDVIAACNSSVGENLRREARISHVSGTWIPIRMSLRPCEYAGKSAVALVMMDITDIKKIQKQLDEKNRQMRYRNEQITRLNQELEETLNRLKSSQQNLIKSERVAAITQTAIAANHEINNPLFSILGQAQLLIMECDAKDENTIQRLRAIEESALRIACVTKKLANLADPVVKEYAGLKTSMIDVDRSVSK